MKIKQFNLDLKIQKNKLFLKNVFQVRTISDKKNICINPICKGHFIGLQLRFKQPVAPV